MLDSEDDGSTNGSGGVYKVGYKKPPLHSRFKPGQSGNPSGRTKGHPNLRTLFLRILAEKVPVREGGNLRSVSKGEALLRALVIGAMKGDTRSTAALFRIAEQAGEFEDPNATSASQQITVTWKSTDDPE